MNNLQKFLGEGSHIISTAMRHSIDGSISAIPSFVNGMQPALNTAPDMGTTLDTKLPFNL